MSDRSEVEEFYDEEFETQDEFDDLVERVTSRAGGGAYKHPCDYTDRARCALCYEWNASDEPHYHPFNGYNVGIYLIMHTCSDCSYRVDKINDKIERKMDKVIKNWEENSEFRDRIKELEEENEHLKEKIARLQEENEKLRT